MAAGPACLALDVVAWMEVDAGGVKAALVAGPRLGMSIGLAPRARVRCTGVGLCLDSRDCACTRRS